MHHRNNILHASTRLPSSEPADPIKANAIRYHSTHDNKYLMYFQGHTAKYVSLQLSILDKLTLQGPVHISTPYYRHVPLCRR